MNAFAFFLQTLGQDEAELLQTLFSLLSSVVAHSRQNGMTPSLLGRLFGPLLFGLPSDVPFDKTYHAYIRTSNATEHLLLSYIRQGHASATGLPPRLQDHVGRYPTCLAADLNMLAPHIEREPLTLLERAVRMFSPDLVQTACEQPWAAWECAMAARPPRWSQVQHKLLPGHERGLRHGQNPASQGTTFAQAEWGQFEAQGFEPPRADVATLRPSPRPVSMRPETMAWTDFAQVGFNRPGRGSLFLGLGSDAPPPLHPPPPPPPPLALKLDPSPSAWHEARELAEDALPPLPGEASVRVEQAGQFDPVFAQVWADYLVSAGWSERDIILARPSNWVLVQLLGLPHESEHGSEVRFNPWFVVSETIPPEYRAALAQAQQRKARKPWSRWSWSNSKSAPSPTLSRSHANASNEFSRPESSLVPRPTADTRRTKAGHKRQVSLWPFRRTQVQTLAQVARHDDWDGSRPQERKQKQSPHVFVEPFAGGGDASRGVRAQPALCGPDVADTTDVHESGPAAESTPTSCPPSHSTSTAPPDTHQSGHTARTMSSSSMSEPVSIAGVAAGATKELAGPMPPPKSLPTGLFAPRHVPRAASEPVMYSASARPAQTPKQHLTPDATYTPSALVPMGKSEAQLPTLRRKVRPLPLAVPASLSRPLPTPPTSPPTASAYDAVITSSTSAETGTRGAACVRPMAPAHATMAQAGARHPGGAGVAAAGACGALHPGCSERPEETEELQTGSRSAWASMDAYGADLSCERYVLGQPLHSLAEADDESMRTSMRLAWRQSHSTQVSGAGVSAA